MGNTIQQLLKSLIIYVCSSSILLQTSPCDFLLLANKATVQFQDNVEHTVLLKDIRPQKVSVYSKQLVLYFCFAVETR